MRSIDARNKLQPSEILFTVKPVQLFDRTCILSGYDTQNIKRNIVFFQQPHGFHNSIERILSLHICSIAVMQLWWSVQRHPHQKMVFRKKRGPFLINRVSVGLYGITN